MQFGVYFSVYCMIILCMGSACVSACHEFISVCVRVLFVAELVLPHPEDVRGVQAGLVRDQRGLVCLPLLPTEQVSHLHPSLHIVFFLFNPICCIQRVQRRSGAIVCIKSELTPNAESRWRLVQRHRQPAAGRVLSKQCQGWVGRLCSPPHR